MASSKIGALRVDLGANTAAFEKGLTAAERKMERFSKQMKAIGGKISGIGKSLSVGITAPVVAAATAFGVAAHKMAGDSREMAKSAQVAGEGFEEFQRQAFAASSVGIEFEKLGDIFKDVRDRVGDFVATGGGPMADFFENIAPKVGVTAESFKGLSGKDGLQLYFDSLRKANVSQEEMVFYLEAMASDATNLIPLLERNGKAFGELGKNAEIISDEERANLEKYTKAQEKLAQATQKLTIALVNSGILETVTALVDKFAQVTSELAETNPTMLKASVVIAGVAAALGPVLVAVGSLVSIAPAVAKGFVLIKGAALALMANPVILGFAAVVTGIYTAWQNWDKIKGFVSSVGDSISSFWSESAKPFFNNLGNSIGNNVSQWWDLHKQSAMALIKVHTTVMEWGAQLVAKMVSVGGDIIAGIVRGIKAAPGAVWQALQDVVGFGVNKIKDYLGINSPSLLFMGIGDNITQGLAIGIRKGGDLVGGAMADVAEGAEVQTVRVADTFKQMADSIMGSLRGLASGVRSGDILGILEGVLGVFTTLSGAGVFGKGLQSKINAPIPGFANGTPFHRGGLAVVGERGPELVNMNRGASVMTSGELRGMSGGKLQVEVIANNNGFGAMVRDEAGNVLAQAAPEIIRAGGNAGVARMQAIAGKRLA